MDAQVHWIFSRLTSDLKIWKKLGEHYRIDLFCGLFLERANRGVTLAPETMAAIAARGAELGFDIYSPKEKGSDP